MYYIGGIEMLKETENFIIEYDDIVYIDKIVEKLEKEMRRILDFFELNNLSKKKKVKIWNNILEYQKHLEKYVPKYYEWMIADTYDGNINVLSIEQCKKTKSHFDIELEKFLKNIIHEFVHSCQQEINSNSKNVEWFWEALATNLGNPFDHVTSIQCAKEDLMNDFNSLFNNYNTAYTIGKYMIEKLSHNKILEYVKNREKLINDTDEIIIGAKKWFNENYLEIPPVPKAENDDFIIYASNSLTLLANDALTELSNNKQRILNFFGLSNYRKVEVNLYDNQNDFIRFLRNIRSPRWFIPSYCKGTFDDYMINHSINLNLLKNDYSKYLKSLIHEFIHIIYNNIVDERITWLDEGLAMNLSGEKSIYDNQENFQKFFEENILSINQIPSMNDLVHGENFVNENYNGYDLSYLVVKYILETMSHNDILVIIKDSNKAKLLGHSVLKDAIKHYTKIVNYSLERKK